MLYDDANATVTAAGAPTTPVDGKLRVAVVAACPFPTPQGSQVFIAQMCERLAERGHEVHLLTYGQGRQVADRGYRHHRIRRLPGDDASRSGPTVIKPVLDLLMAASLARLVAAERIDVIHCHNYEAAAVGLAVRSRRRIPVVYHSHNLMGDELATYFHRSFSRALAGAAGRLLDASVPSRADHAIALCEHTRSVLLARGVRPERVSVIPAAVDDEGPAGAPEPARQALGLPPDAFVIGYCGNLDGYQNLDLLLAASALLTRWGNLSVRLILATHATGRDLERHLSRYGIVARTSVVRLGDDYERSRLVLAASDALVLPRRHGSGYPIKLLNYMGAGRAIVAAGCGGKVLQDGVDGLVVADDDPCGLAHALERIAGDRDLAARLGRAARARFVASLTWKQVLPDIEAAYRRVLGSSDAPMAAHAG